MLLDYNSGLGYFILRVSRGEADIQELMTDHGLDLSEPQTTAASAVLFTKEPYAAATFASCATPQARAALGGILGEIEASWAPSNNTRIKCPEGKELWPFQIADVAYALRRQNTLVGDQPGLGKTPVAICFANEIAARRVLVLCPANIRLQWVKRIREWTTLRWPYQVYPILHGRHGVHPTAEWTVVSFDLARTEAIGKALAKGRYDLLILDEAHYLKTVDSKRTRAVFGGGDSPLFDHLASRSDRILALTGTPLPNRPREAYTLARGMCFDSIDFMSEAKFSERFNPSMKMEKFDPVTGRTKVWVDERTGRHAELQNRLRANFMIRHLKRDVMPQLKMPLYDIVLTEETGPIKQALKAESLLGIDPECLDGADAEVLGHIAAVRRQMGIAKAPLAAEFAQMVLDGGEEKIVLFAWHIAVLDILQKELEAYGVVRVDGSHSPRQKQQAVDDFRSNRGLRVFLGNMQSVGTGTDGLQDVSAHAIFAECSWVPGENEQCVDRLDRGGQQRTVQADFLVAPGSLDERVLSSALRKKQTTHKALDHRL